MKIWLLTTDDPVFSSGGIARYVDIFARKLVDQGNDVTVICPSVKGQEDSGPYRVVRFLSSEENENRLSLPGEEVDAHPRWPYNNMCRPISMSYEFFLVVNRLLEAEGAPDVIECQDYQAIGYFILQNKRLRTDYLDKTPFVLFLHTPDFVVQQYNEYPRYRLPDYWVGQLEKACMKLADAVLAPCQFMVDQLKECFGCALEEAKVFPYPVRTSSDQPALSGIEGKLLFLGRVELRKGIEPLLKVCDSLWRKGYTFSLDVVGGEVPLPTKSHRPILYYSDKYKQWVEAGLLTFHHGVIRKEARKFMEECHGVVLPSLWENFPFVNLEAMALGKAVLASRQGGHAEILQNNDSGMLFDVENLADFESRFIEFLALTDAQRIKMGTAAQLRLVEYCSEDEIVRKRVEHFRELCAKPSENNRIYPFMDRHAVPGVQAERIPEDAKVSVVVPFYNLGEYVEECIDSILATRFVEFEILIINDGSSEPESLAALERIRNRNDKRIRIIDLVNGGLANARNVGARSASFPVLAFVDADDCVEPEFLSKGMQVFKRFDNVHIVSAWTRFFGDVKGIWHSWNLEFPFLLCHNQMIPICMVRKDSFLRFGQNKPHIVYGLEDYEGWISMLKNGCGGVAIPETLVRYRVRNNSMFRQIQTERQLYLYDLIIQEHEDLIQEYGFELYQLQNANGPAHSWDQPTAFRAPIEQLKIRYELKSARLDELEADYRRVKEAEAWHIQERKRYLPESEVF